MITNTSPVQASNVSAVTESKTETPQHEPLQTQIRTTTNSPAILSKIANSRVKKEAYLSLYHVKNQKETAIASHPAYKFLTTGRTSHHRMSNSRHLADCHTAKVMQDLYQEGDSLQSATHSLNIINKILDPVRNAFAIATQGKLNVLTQPISLHIMSSPNGNKITLAPSQQLTEKQWLKENDKQGNFLVLNGNNDETYVKLVAKTTCSTNKLRFITSGFGGHGTTDRHSIAINKTEAYRFKEILVENGIPENRIYTDHLSTNSGQNSINVADILTGLVGHNNEFNKIIVAGTPPAVLRQTYTYAKQFNFPQDKKEEHDLSSRLISHRTDPKSFYVESFPFTDSEKYTTTADHLAILREFSTTLNYMANTSFLPAEKKLFPDSFFNAAVDSIQKTATELEKSIIDTKDYRTQINALKSISPEMMTRMKNNVLEENDKQNIKQADDFFRNLFNPLELTFKRTFL